MKNRHVTVRRGRHVGWWVVGRRANGGLFMYTWWPARSLAMLVARVFGGPSPQQMSSP